MYTQYIQANNEKIGQIKNIPRVILMRLCPRDFQMKWMRVLLPSAISHDHHLCLTNHLHLWGDSFHYNLYITATSSDIYYKLKGKLFINSLFISMSS